MKSFPRTVVGGVSLPRLLIGTNWMSGFSHTGAAKDNLILNRNSSPEQIVPILETFLKYDINAIMGMISVNDNLCRAIALAEERTNKKMIIIDEPILNVDNSYEGRREAQRQICLSSEKGATFCMPMHCCVEELVNKNKHTIERISDYMAMIREAGMIPGLSAHMPEIILFSDENGYDVETYIQIFNCMGFLMQVEIESVARIIHNAKKPVMTIKPCAAGRTTPYVGLNFSWNTIRERDMVTIGCLTEDEAEEDIEISFAAIERRLPRLKSRNSPKVTDIIRGSYQTYE